MTIGAWVVVGVIALTGVVPAAILVYTYICDRGYDAGEKWMPITAISITLVTIAVCLLFIWYRGNSESGKRALKDQESNLNGGIERIVSVYDINGELIKQYHGKFDIETDQRSYILFDDENGNRHIIYYTTGTILVEEKGEET